MVAYIWVNVGSGEGLLADSTKPLPDPMLTYQLCMFYIRLRAVSQEMAKIL